MTEWEGGFDPYAKAIELLAMALEAHSERIERLEAVLEELIKGESK